MGDYVFEEPPADPPTPTPRNTAWHRRLDPLRAHPGKWARLNGDYVRTVASQIRGGHLPGVEPGEFEVKHKRIEEGSDRWHVWVRYVGDQDQERFSGH